MKPIKLIGLLLMVTMVNVPEATAKKQYSKPKCGKGAKVEQGSAAMSFRCRMKKGVTVEEFRAPTCEEGAILEQRSGKFSFRCRREGGMVEEFKTGRCERNQRLRRGDSYGFNFTCQGTTIGIKGGAGIDSTQAIFECPPKYQRVSEAPSAGRTCVRRVPGTAYERPAF